MKKKKRSDVDPKDRRSWTVNTRMIAESVGLTRRAVRDEIFAGRLNPADLKSLSLFVAGHLLIRQSLSPAPCPQTTTKTASNTDSGYDYSDSQERRNPFDLTGSPAEPRSGVPF